jgi:AcrR family transcriptional regulator
LNFLYDVHNMTVIMLKTPSRKTHSHDRIVEVASRAIRRTGYRGVGVADIMKEAGLTHGGFYAHFASRDALMIEAMQRAARENQDALAAAMQRRMSKGDSRFAALIRSYLNDALLDRPEQSCVVAALASDMPRQDDAVRAEARKRVTDLVELVQETLPPGTDASHAAVITATMVGTLQLARTLGGPPGRSMLSQTRDALIQRYAPPS